VLLPNILNEQRTSGKKTKIVPTRTPTEKVGLHWGYVVRQAASLSEVFTSSPLGEYDLTIGTSERGSSIDETVESLAPFK
jgi:predicted SPOUT superfamily RNA methylase MTH1